MSCGAGTPGACGTPHQGTGWVAGASDGAVPRSKKAKIFRTHPPLVRAPHGTVGTAEHLLFPSSNIQNKYDAHINSQRCKSWLRT